MVRSQTRKFYFVELLKYQTLCVSIMPLEQRITLRQLSPNPMFEQWLSEWLSYAERKNSMKKHALAKALDSLRRYPLVMHSGRDCCILDGFGQTICRMIDKQLEVYRTSEGSSNDAVRRLMSEADCDRSVHEVIGKVQAEMVKIQQQKKRKKVVEPQNPIGDLFSKYDEPTADLENVVPEVRSEKPSDNIEIVIPANSYEIVLLVDTQETAG